MTRFARDGINSISGNTSPIRNKHMYGDNAALAIDKNADSQKYTWNGNMFD